jgi:hypothetical protein
MPEQAPLAGRDFTSPARFLSFTITTASRERVDQSLQLVLSRIKLGRFRRFTAPLSLSTIYEVEPPAGGAHPFKLVLYTPSQVPKCCVVITNKADGWNSLFHLIAKEHHEFQIQVISTQDDVEYPKNKIEIWRSGQSVRTVMVIRDSDKWVFFEKGEIEKFEQQHLYKNRIKKMRLNRNHIIEYCQSIGWDITKDSFWKTDQESIYYEEIQGL